MSETNIKGSSTKAEEPITQSAQKQKEAEPANKQTIADIELELKKLELEEKRLAVELSKANLIDTHERLGERELRRQNVRQRSLVNGETLKQINNTTKAQQFKCNHKKGGNGLVDFVSGRGDDTSYAVFRHTFANGDTEVFCLRCHKRWRRPSRSEHTTEEAFQTAVAEHKQALEFSTKNVASSGALFRFSDNGEYYRELTKNG